MIVKLNIQCYEGRCDMVNGLANNGYKTWIEKVKGSYSEGTKFFVCFEYEPEAKDE